MVTKLIMSLFFCFSLTAQDQFSHEFEIDRDEDGRLLSLKRKGPNNQLFSVKTYLKYLKSQITHERERLQEQSYFMQQQQELKRFSDKKLFAEALEEIKNFDVDAFFENKKILIFMNEFEAKLNEKLAILDLRIIAKPNDTEFFIKKKRTYQAVTWALKLAKKMFSNGQVLNFVTNIIQKSEQALLAQREFEQAKLMHYLENYDAADLGLTHEEVNHLMSSLFESKRPWYNFWDKDLLNDKWDSYGFKNFYTLFRNGTKRLDSNSDKYQAVLTRYNYAFQEVMIDDKKVVVNIQNQTHMFNAAPSVAFDYEDPQRVFKKRILLELICVGMGQLTGLPSFIRDLSNQFLTSLYKTQTRTEGALAAHFLENGETEEYQSIISQSLNPYLRK